MQDKSLFELSSFWTEVEFLKANPCGIPAPKIEAQAMWTTFNDASVDLVLTAVTDTNSNVCPAKLNDDGFDYFFSYEIVSIVNLDDLGVDYSA